MLLFIDIFIFVIIICGPLRQKNLTVRSLVVEYSKKTVDVWCNCSAWFVCRTA